MADGAGKPSAVRGRSGGAWPLVRVAEFNLSPNVRTSPEATIAVARQRVAQFEGALAAFGDATGPEVTMLQNFAKKAAQEPTIRG